MKTCIHCNKELKLESFRDKSEYRRARFCNSECYRAYWAMQFIEKMCPICNTIYKVSKFQKIKRKTCSVKCSYEYRKCLGHKYITTQGYVAVKTFSEFADSNGYELEHRYIMRLHLGRPLITDEHVHHKNENKTNNTIGNLELHGNSQHQCIHESHKRINTEESLQKRIETRWGTKLTVSAHGRFSKNGYK